MEKKDSLKKQLEDIKKEYSSAADIILNDRDEKGSKVVLYSIILSVLIFIILFYFLSPTTQGIIFRRIKKIGEINYEKPKPLILKLKINKAQSVKQEKDTNNLKSKRNSFSKNSKKNVPILGKKRVTLPEWRKPKLKVKCVIKKKKLSELDRAIQILEDLKPKLADIIKGKNEAYRYKKAKILKKNSDIVLIDLTIIITSTGEEKHLVWRVDTANKKVSPIGFETANFELSGNL